MRRFQFRLETLLQHRRNVEERERTRFSRLSGELMGEVKRIEALRVRHAETLSELAPMKLGDCDSREIAWFYRFLDRLTQEMEQTARRIEELEKKVEAQKQVMISATRDKKMIENLRTRRAKEFLVSSQREEQKSVDEIVVTRFARKP